MSAGGRTNAKAREAGAKFRELRNRTPSPENHWRLEDVEYETYKRFGEENGIKVSQLSHIEKGDHGRLSIDDAVTLGKLYGLTPNQVAAMYGLWTERGEKEAQPPGIVQTLSLLDRLPSDLAEDLESDIEWLVSKYTAKQRERAAGGKRRTEPPASVRN